LNEFLPDPFSLYTEEWIELYNPLNEEADVSGYIIDDITTGGTSPYTIPGGSVIPAYGYLVLWQSTTGIALNNDGDTVNYLKPDGTTVLDSYTYPSSTDDVSYGRETDGGLPWTTFDVPTPGDTNGQGTANGDSVLLNEFLPDPLSLYTEEWIELYNPLSEEADVSGYIIDDITTGGTSPYTIPDGTVIPANGYLVLWQSTTGIAMNNDGDTVNYLKPDGTTVLDSYTYTSSTDDVSYGRETDGSSTWTTFTTPTPGATNGGGTQDTPVHVASISFSNWFSGNGRTEYLDITIVVHDDTGSPAAGVTVSGELEIPGGTFESFSGETDANGEVIFTYVYKPNKHLPDGTYTFTVTDLSGTGFVYDSGANIETSDSWVK
jgi:hypothetical protein